MVASHPANWGGNTFSWANHAFQYLARVPDYPGFADGVGANTVYADAHVEWKSAEDIESWGQTSFVFFLDSDL